MRCYNALSDILERQKAKALINLQPKINQLISEQRKRLKIIPKGRGDYTTNVDLAVEDFLCNQEFIREDDVLSEERIKNFTGKKYCWLIDPIDGTVKGLIKGSLNFSVLVTLTKKYLPIFSWIYLPSLDVWYLAVFKQTVVRGNGKVEEILTARRPLRKDYLINFNGVFFEYRGDVAGRSKSRNFIDIYLELLERRFRAFLVDYSKKKIMWAHDYYPLWTLLSTCGLRVFNDALQSDVRFNSQGVLMKLDGTPIRALAFARDKKVAAHMAQIIKICNNRRENG